MLPMMKQCKIGVFSLSGFPFQFACVFVNYNQFGYRRFTCTVGIKFVCFATGFYALLFQVALVLFTITFD